VDEVWTGVEYQVAAHMLYEGMFEEGLAIVKGARDRYDGAPRDPMPRNPWNEIECGGHYARAMSSWSILTALSGFRYDGIEANLFLTPRHTPENFKSLFTGPEGWGSVRQVRSPKLQRNEIALVEGTLKLSTIHLEVRPEVTAARVSIGSRKLDVHTQVAGGMAVIQLPAGISARAGETVVIALS